MNLKKVLRALGTNCGLARTPSTDYFDKRPSERKINSLKSYLIDYIEIPSKDLPLGVEFGIKFQSWSFNCPMFLLNLQQYIEGKNVSFTRKRFAHVKDAFSQDTKVVFNCTGLGARVLGGVQDSAVYPTRGQVVVVRAPHIQENIMRWGEDYATYAIKRPHSHDQLILGGFMQKNDWTADTLRSQTLDILDRINKTMPQVFNKNSGSSELEIIRVVAGLRPSRIGGVRIEKQSTSEGLSIVHNYGASGYGYQAGLGMAERAVQLALGKVPKL